MNVKVITTALNCLIGSVALTFVNDNQSLELATKAAVSRHGREAIVMYQWYSACVQEPSLDDFEVWLARQVEKHPNFKKEVESWRQYFQRHPEEQEAARAFPLTLTGTHHKKVKRHAVKSTNAKPEIALLRTPQKRSSTTSLLSSRD